MPMVAGVLVSSIVVGRIITRTGRYKRWMVLGSVLLIAGLALMGTIRSDTSFALLGLYLGALGLGVGMLMQNLVLVVQNTVRLQDMGAASATVAFFRSLGGAVGVAALGALLASLVTALVTSGLAELGIPATAGGQGIPDLATLPPPVRLVVEAAYGEGIADLFLAAVPLGIVALVAVALLPEVPLGTRSGIERAEQERARPPADRVATQSVGQSAEEASADAAGLPWEAVSPELEEAYQPAAGSPKRSRSAEETRSR